MKYEWKKHDRELYGAKRTPTLITVPKQNYIMISGSGNPNDQDFSKKAAALYAFAYALKMDYKAAAIMNNNEVHDFAVYPLEVVWSLKHGDRPDRRESEYSIMIRQPHFITENMTTSVLERIKAKKPNSLYSEMRFDTMQDGKCIEILHIGSYDDEPASFEKMAQFAKDHGLTCKENSHREIHLNNPKRVETNRLKTILRYPIITSK